MSARVQALRSLELVLEQFEDADVALFFADDASDEESWEVLNVRRQLQELVRRLTVNL